MARQQPVASWPCHGARARPKMLSQNKVTIQRPRCWWWHCCLYKPRLARDTTQRLLVASWGPNSSYGTNRPSSTSLVIISLCAPVSQHRAPNNRLPNSAPEGKVCCCDERFFAPRPVKIRHVASMGASVRQGTDVFFDSLSVACHQAEP